MRLYLDNCCYNRPYDEQTQFTVLMETRAKIHIQGKIQSGEYELADSFMLEFENNANPNEMAKAAIQRFRDKYSTVFVPFERKDELQGQVDDIMDAGVKYKDATHLACAVYAHCDYFLTTDKRLLKYKNEAITTINPLEFLLLEGEEK